ncbi:Cytochrome P450 [Trinorchestia longiramus]|nr:Cytochrome P450 [Trinorchestia longiramus]
MTANSATPDSGPKQSAVEVLALQCVVIILLLIISLSSGIFLISHLKPDAFSKRELLPCTSRIFSSDMWTELLAAVVVLLLTVLYFYCRKKHQYWKKLGIHTPTFYPVLGHIPYGFSVKKLRHIWIDEEYRRYRDERMIGLYEVLTPSLSIHDPKLVMSVCVKDFDHFVDRRSVDLKGTNNDVLNDMLTNATGSHWKSLRALMTPTFTSGKMKDMFHLIQDQSSVFVRRCRDVRDENLIVNLKEYFSSFTMDVIACCAFGLETSTLEGKNKEFLKMATDTMKTSFTQILKSMVFMMSPKVAKALKMKFMSSSMQYLERVARDAIQAREQGDYRGDFLDLLLEVRESSDSNDLDENKLSTKKLALNDSTIVAQCLLFLLAGFDTTANTLSFTSALLARNPQIQEALRAELKNKLRDNEDGKLSYQNIMECKYMDAVLSETLRMYPPAHAIERKCIKDYQIPESSIKINKGMMVSIPVYSLQHDERYFPDPEVFNPERFLPENKGNILSGTYLPFGLGPRMCIAERFARMESKLVLADLVLNFDLSVPAECEELKIAKVLGILRPDPESVKIILKDVAVH